MKREQLEQRTGIHARYLEEWLAAMLCSGYVEHDADADTWLLPDEHAMFFASPASEYCLGGLFKGAPVMAAMAPQLASAFETGQGISFQAYGEGTPMALEVVGMVFHEGRRAQDHVVEPAGREHLLDRVLGAEEVDRMIRPRAVGRGVDETRNAGRARSRDQRTVAGGVDRFGAPSATADEPVRRGEHALHAIASTRQRGWIGQVAGHHFGAERSQVGGLLRVAVQRAHLDPSGAQPLHDRPAQGTRGADDEHFHWERFCALAAGQPSGPRHRMDGHRRPAVRGLEGSGGTR